MKELEGHTGPLTGLAFSPDGRWLASGAGGESFVQLWDAATLAPEGRLRVAGGEDSPAALRFSPDSRHIAARLGRRTMVWNVKARRLRFDSYAVRGCGADEVAFSRDGKTLYGLRVDAGPSDSTIDVGVWASPVAGLKATPTPDARGPDPWPVLSETVPCPFWHNATLVGPTADGALLLRCFVGLLEKGPWAKSREFAFRLSPETGLVRPLNPKTYRLTSALISPDGRRLVVPASRGQLRCLDLSTDPPAEVWCRTLDGGKSAEFLTFSGCGRYLAVADAAGVVRVLEAEGGDERLALDWGQGAGKSRAQVRALALSPGGAMLAVGGTRRTVTVVERSDP